MTASVATRLVSACRECVERSPVVLGFEYKSPATIGGWPLLHICAGIDPVTMRPRAAKGVIAIGNIAFGGLAMGGLAVGLDLDRRTLDRPCLRTRRCGAGTRPVGGGFALGSVAIGGAAVGFTYAIGGAAFGPCRDRRPSLR